MRDGQIVIRQMMNLSISLDHRIVDGYEGAMFLQHVVSLLEDPTQLFMELGVARHSPPPPDWSPINVDAAPRAHPISRPSGVERRPISSSPPMAASIPAGSPATSAMRCCGRSIAACCASA